jgi:hypothetical protein
MKILEEEQPVPIELQKQEEVLALSVPMKELKSTQKT